MRSVTASGNIDGEHNGGARLTWQKVHEIRELKSQGWKNKELAERYSVARNTVSEIVNGHHWRDMRDQQPLPDVKKL